MHSIQQFSTKIRTQLEEHSSERIFEKVNLLVIMHNTMHDEIARRVLLAPGRERFFPFITIIVTDVLASNY